MDEFAEDLPGTVLPAVLEHYLASERAWHRMLRGTGLASPEEAAQALRRWVEQ